MLVYGKYECFVMQMLYVCVLCASCGSSQCCILLDFLFVKIIEDAKGDHDYLICCHEYLFLFTHPVAVSAFINL